MRRSHARATRTPQARSRAPSAGEATVRETVSARLERQEVLYETGKTFRFVVTEPVLRWLIVRAETFATPVAAWEWLSAELAENPPPASALPVETLLAQDRDCLDREADAYVGYHTAQGARFLVRALLTCPREGGGCPAAPVTP